MGIRPPGAGSRVGVVVVVAVDPAAQQLLVAVHPSSVAATTDNAGRSRAGTPVRGPGGTWCHRGAWRNAYGQQELDELFTTLGRSFSDCTSYVFELQAYDVSGDMACTAGLEHVSASVDAVPRTYTRRATQVYRREEGRWRVAHRHGDSVTE
ncbi:nuclear transport factor 2 family protein [Streptomyces massasporeus]|uniref:nuclear transport factor 2 family protein n=1 Tax=Streptomyces massasporeus TaxID=67324 RepID=UPI00369B332D